MRDNTPRAYCADCTARYGAPRSHRIGQCQHDSGARFVPLTRGDLFVPAESLERSPRVDVVALAQLFVIGRDLYRSLTRGDAWKLDNAQRSHALASVATPWGGATFSRDGGNVAPTSGYAVTIRPRAAAPVFVTLSSPVERFDEIVDGFSTRAPYVGVFRDEMTQSVDVDPVAIVATRREADALGVYCRSTGGAYSFADGLGYWAPVL